MLKHYTDEEVFGQIDAAVPPLVEDPTDEGIH
jgi:hypothetical protein